LVVIHMYDVILKVSDGSTIAVFCQMLF
jgi:hypothetical protein